MPPRIPLLAFLSRNKGNLEDLAFYREVGHGSIASGLGSVLGDVIASVAKGGSQIVRSIGVGIRDTLGGVSDLDHEVVGSISNATANVITSASSGLANVIDSLGGWGSLILWPLVLFLYVYLIMMRLGIGPLRNPFRSTAPDSELIPLKPPPCAKNHVCSTTVPTDNVSQKRGRKSRRHHSTPRKRRETSPSSKEEVDV